jgi:hypothetical protein
MEKAREFGTITPSDGKSQPTLPKVELDDDGESIISLPLYPLSRSDTGESRRGLLRQDTIGSNPYLTRTDTAASTDSNLSRQNTNPIGRYDANISRAPSRPATAATAATDARPLTRGDSNTRTATRQPTLPHLVGDFSIPELPRPATTRSDSRTGRNSPPGSSSNSPPPNTTPRQNPFPSRNPSQPPRNPAGRRFGPPPRSNTAEVGPYRPPLRSDIDEGMGRYGPPQRSNTNPPTMRGGYPPLQRYGQRYR